MAKKKKLSNKAAVALRSINTRKKEPLWKGPEVDGITQSMLGSFLVCRERFRLSVIEGLSTLDGFNYAIEYGQMWHTCQEGLASSPGMEDWKARVELYARSLCRKYPLQQEQIEHWHSVCKVQFSVYVQHQAKMRERKQRVSLLTEKVFRVPYELPSGRTILLRGKWDGVDLVGRGRGAGVYLEEHKTKGEINEEHIERQLMFDLQTMFYLVALGTYFDQPDIKVGRRVKGISYNVVRRPLSGGKGSIRQHKPTKSNPAGESLGAFYKRLGGVIDDDPGYFFMRWIVEVTDQDIKTFREQFLDPVLEEVCDWYGWVSHCYARGFSPFIMRGKPKEAVGRFDFSGPKIKRGHWRHPYGVWNPMDRGRVSDLDEYLATGSETGLVRNAKLFRELE